jgi:hypothetical protein
VPRPIHVPQGEPGISTYTLSANEEWSLLSATFTVLALSGAGGDNFAWIDYRDPTGGIIYLQPLAISDGGNVFYSLSTDAEPFATNDDNPPFWPQSTDDYDYYYATQRLSSQTLYTGCTVNAYKTAGLFYPPTDPITQVSSFYTIPDLHLWVEDTAASVAQTQDTPVLVGPYMLVPGPVA